MWRVPTVQGSRSEGQQRVDSSRLGASRRAGHAKRLTPLDERLTRLLATIPIEVQRERCVARGLASVAERPQARQLPPIQIHMNKPVPDAFP